MPKPPPKFPPSPTPSPDPLPVAPPAARAVPVKIVDVARAAGVSPTTVSHALNDRGDVDPKTRQAVKDIAQRMGYRPNRHAQRLRTGGAHMIVLVSSMPFAVAGGPSRLGFLMEIAAVAASAALSRGLALVLVPPVESNALAIDNIDVDGALVVEPTATDAHMAHLARRGVPVVTIGRQPGAAASLSCVNLRSGDTTLQLLEHLRAQGARRIALLIGEQQRSSYIEAEAAYLAFAAERRMKPIVRKADEGRGEEAGREAALELMAANPRIDAICAPVDAFAVGATRALGELGLAVPRDVMVATRYDGARARHNAPPLTSLDLHLEAVAGQAIELLLEQLSGPAPAREVAAPAASLVVRESTQRRPG